MVKNKYGTYPKGTSNGISNDNITFIACKDKLLFYQNFKFR